MRGAPFRLKMIQVYSEGTALRARGADGVERPERRVRRRRRAANIRRDGLTRASVARNQALAP